MGLKKYEIITVGSDKRVRALRSWRVQDRYVNIGDVGGIVYDEKTLSQDGACWLFRGNFGFPGARIGGDSIVDVGEATLSATGAPNVDIIGSSVVVGSKLQFASDQTAADAITLTAADFEQGGTMWVRAGASYESMKTSSGVFLRSKNPIFLGGVGVTLKCDVPGYTVVCNVFDRDMNAITASSEGVNTGEGVTVAASAGQYLIIRLAKNPSATIVPADATAAQITFTSTYETKLSIVDSRLEINPATSAGTTTIRPGGTYTFASGAKYPEAIIRNSKVSMSVTAVANRSYRIMGQIIESTATLDATAGDVSVAGQYSNIKNLMASGTITSNLGVTSYNVIQAYNCDNMVVSPTNFPGLAAMQTAGVPIKFYNCNLNNGRFYHHAQIANTYRDVNFDLATTDLGKQSANGNVMVSSEVNGMYRAWFEPNFGALIESYESVKSASLSNITGSYATTIYADAYFNGLFYLKGTNVFGNSMKHEASNTQNVMAVQGNLNATGVGGKITGIVSSATLVCVPEPFRVNGSKGLTISNLPAGFEASIFLTDANSVITSSQSTVAANTNLTATALVYCKAYIRFKKSSGDPITPDDVKGITVTTYNGCKLVNTKATAAVIDGNVRVEDNATVIDTSVTGTGYFGGNSIIQAPSALVGQLPIGGAVYMSDNAVFAPTEMAGTPTVSLLNMRDNAMFAGRLNVAGARYIISMADNAQFLGTIGYSGNFNMHGNSFVASSGNVISACRGLLTMKDDARIEDGSITTIGHITLCGKYKQTANKTWTGKRVIASQDAPTYDDNVKTKYDF